MVKLKSQSIKKFLEGNRTSDDSIIKSSTGYMLFYVDMT